MKDVREEHARRVAFVEAKTPDWARLQRICEVSAREGRWANFGPVNAALAEAVARRLDLPGDRAVVPASSATAALQAIAGMRAVRAGRPLRWLVSAYSFFSPSIGGFHDRIVVIDCDGSGLLDIDLAVRTPDEAFDGVILTNVFGLTADLSRFGAFCRERNKPLVVDNALAFPGPRPVGAACDEIISFHHTKPWGFGEGGCAIVSAGDAELVRGFLNFGVGVGAGHGAFALNGKLSDLAAAAILDRVERLEAWAPGYREQRARIVDLAETAGLPVLGTPSPEAASPHVPVLAPAAAPLDALPRARFDVRKYYRPLAPGRPTAQSLYARMINVPCHPGMAGISDEELSQFFSALQGTGT